MSNWAHLTLDELCNFEKGTTGLASAVAGEYPLVATGAERRSCDTFQFDTAAVCIPLVSSTGHGHASLNHVHYQEGKFALGTILVAVTPKDANVLNTKFLHLYLSRLKDIILVPLMTGAANVSLSVSKIKQVKIPVPSISEQLKVVSLFNRMDNEQSELSDEISTQQELLKKLRQSILQEAIEGKLSAQWRQENPDVEPASKLLEKIRVEKEQLIKEKKIKKEKPLLKINDDEVPFDLPDNWKWIRLGDIGFSFRGKSPKYAEESDYFAINQKCVRWGYLDLEFSKKISQEWFLSIGNFSLTKKNDILINSTGEGTIGRAAIVESESEGLIYDSHVLLFRSFIMPSVYALHCINSQFGQTQIDDSKGAKTTKQTELGVDKLINLKLPMPPFEEQKVLVKKIENLFSLCDELEQQINESKANAEMLMQAVLKEAFESH